MEEKQAAVEQVLSLPHGIEELLKAHNVKDVSELAKILSAHNSSKENGSKEKSPKKKRKKGEGVKQEKKKKVKTEDEKKEVDREKSPKKKKRVKPTLETVKTETGGNVAEKNVEKKIKKEEKSEVKKEEERKGQRTLFDLKAKPLKDVKVFKQREIQISTANLVPVVSSEKRDTVERMLKDGPDILDKEVLLRDLVARCKRVSADKKRVYRKPHWVKLVESSCEALKENPSISICLASFASDDEVRRGHVRSAIHASRVSGRRPFERDEAIDYDIYSEDEYLEGVETLDELFAEGEEEIEDLDPEVADFIISDNQTNAFSRTIQPSAQKCVLIGEQSIKIIF